MLHIPALWYFDTSITCPQWFRRVKFVLIPPRFVQQQYLWNIAIQPAVGCYISWANIRCSGCSPLGEISLWNGTISGMLQYRGLLISLLWTFLILQEYLLDPSNHVHIWQVSVAVNLCLGAWEVFHNTWRALQMSLRNVINLWTVCPYCPICSLICVRS